MDIAWHWLMLRTRNKHTSWWLVGRCHQICLQSIEYVSTDAHIFSHNPNQLYNGQNKNENDYCTSNDCIYNRLIHRQHLQFDTILYVLSEKIN